MGEALGTTLMRRFEFLKTGLEVALTKITSSGANMALSEVARASSEASIATYSAA